MILILRDVSCIPVPWSLRRSFFSFSERSSIGNISRKEGSSPPVEWMVRYTLDNCCDVCRFCSFPEMQFYFSNAACCSLLFCLHLSWVPPISPLPFVRSFVFPLSCCAFSLQAVQHVDLWGVTRLVKQIRSAIRCHGRECSGRVPSSTQINPNLPISITGELGWLEEASRLYGKWSWEVLKKIFSS